ncbi:hypothetical protein [Nocardioides sp. SYSU DS0651]|uniref:hypothetical protein n=1 Tax=Nocardioides sp. SYSU DS0651 TaxID=3415955 RepID=UPI003F4CA81A
MEDTGGTGGNRSGTDGVPEAVEVPYERFGVNWVRRVLNLERVLRTVDQVLGDQLVLGPIGAGPGRAFASVSIVGTYHPTTGAEVPGRPLLTYAVDLPISVTFDLDVPLDTLTFNAEVVVPLTIVVHTEEPVRLRLEIGVPTEEQIGLQLSADTRRGAVLQKVAGLEAELRRFLIRVLRTELAKPYVRRATSLDMERLIDAAWPAISAQFLPAGPADRQV